MRSHGRRHRSPVEAPASASRSTPMICSSVKPASTHAVLLLSPGRTPIINGPVSGEEVTSCTGLKARALVPVHNDFNSESTLARRPTNRSMFRAAASGSTDHAVTPLLEASVVKASSRKPSTHRLRTVSSSSSGAGS